MLFTPKVGPDSDWLLRYIYHGQSPAITAGHDAFDSLTGLGQTVEQELGVLSLAKSMNKTRRQVCRYFPIASPHSIPSPHPHL